MFNEVKKLDATTSTMTTVQQQQKHRHDINIITLDNNSVGIMEQYDNGGLYSYKDANKIYHGMMHSLRGVWVLSTPAINKFARYKSSYNKEENQCYIHSEEIGFALSHIIQRSYTKLKSKYTHLKLYDYGPADNYFKFSDRFAIFDEQHQNITSNFDWSVVNGQLMAKFLIRIYGVFVYDSQGSRTLKLITKIEQMKLCGFLDASALPVNEDYVSDLFSSSTDVCFL